MRGRVFGKGTLKLMILAGVMLFGFHSGFAQQEVNPDHFDGNDATVARKARAARTRPTHATQQQTTPEKNRKPSAVKRSNAPAITAKKTSLQTVAGHQ